MVYVNGVEVTRSNMPAGAPAHATLASANVAPGAAENYSATIPTTNFVNGNNTIAVELHLRQANAADMSFDMELQATPVDVENTFSSSTADLSLSGCNQVLFAGLYWGADEGSSGTDSTWITAGYNTCKLKIPGGSYQTITSTQTDRHSNGYSPALGHTGYMCFADITSLVNANSPNGTYAVANVICPSGVTNACGGWTIVIVYSNATLPPRNITVFDGEAIINSGDPAVDVNVTGFLTPASGTVSCELGAVVFDGDRGSADAWKFKQNGAAGFYDLATTTIPLIGAGDAWNSVIAYKSSVVTTRSPAFQNTLGYDSKIIDLPNAGNAQLGNNKTSAIVQFSSTSENYFVQVLTTSITQFNPSIPLQKTASDVNGGTLVSGDVLRYTIAYNNVGNDGGTGSIITDFLPMGTGYVPGSLKINGVAKTDGSGDDQAEYSAALRKVTFRIGTGATSAVGGTVAAGASGTVSFDVYMPSSCVITNCVGASFSNSARIDYTGQTTSQVLYDSSYYDTGGSCFALGPVANGYSPSCSNPGDTTLINICPTLSIQLPWLRYAGYTFYSGMPFTAGNVVPPGTAISSSGIYYAYFNSGTGCSDTIRITVLHQNCPDLDEDDDGIPDYVELGDPVALQDADGDGILNWYDLDYPGRVDNNSDGLNDNFDPGADSDNDGIVNFMDPNWPGYVDSNGDGVNDNFDKDKDGIPDFLDRDSDNDGIPDTVESFGVDANGDGKIDNFSDSDNDGLSQNVDASGPGATSIYGSGLGLGKIDTDGDGIPNYLDLDSDNDGIPDIVEVYGTDANNDGMVDVFTDNDLDGLADAIDGDVGNDGTAENAAAGLLLTGTDGNNDGRTDSWPNKNMDSDTRPNPYDLDSDNDGITDVKEAGFSDTNWNGQEDGSINSNGWSTTIAAMGSLSLPNTDGTGRANPYDIDSDDDGIPDNVEGMTTLGYLLPGATDTDGDGLLNTYDNFNGFGGDGIHPVDTDGDSIPDYMDSDTDGDGLIDRIEGNDLNLNGLADDNVTLTGSDTDGDGLDNRFDNSNLNEKGTSAYMGNGGSLSGDASPGSITTVQHTWVANFMGCPSERDWRCVPYILSCNITVFKGVLFHQVVQLNWSALCRQDIDHFIVQRSTDRINFSDIAAVPGRVNPLEAESYSAADNIAQLTADRFFYRLVSVYNNGKISISNIIVIRNDNTGITDMQLSPNPVREQQFQVTVASASVCVAELTILDANGKLLQHGRQTLQPGSNTFTCGLAASLPPGMYYLRLNCGERIYTSRFTIIK